MAAYLLDTSVIIDTLNGKRERGPMLERLLLGGNTLGCCAINIGEVYSGMRAAEARATDELLSSLDYYEITREAAKRAGIMRYQHARSGRTLHLADMIIASVAIEYGLTLITDNTKDFRVSGLRLLPF